MTEEDVVTTVLQHGYAINSFELLSHICGSQSIVWKLHCNGCDLALRRTRNLSREKLSSYLLLAQLLSDNGINVARPMATVNGDLFCQCNGESFTLSTWMEGVTVHEYTPDLETARLLGGLLAQIHTILANYHDPLPLATRRYQNSSDAITHVSKLLAVIESKETKSKDDRNIMDALHYKLDFLERQSDLDSSVVALYDDCQLIHGDFNSGNIIFDSQGTFVGLIDLESFHHAPRIWDIVKACMFTFKASREHCIQFIAGYHHVNPLCRREIDAFYPLAIDYMLKSNWAYEQYLVFDNQQCNINSTVLCHETLLEDRSSYISLSDQLA